MKKFNYMIVAALVVVAIFVPDAFAHVGNAELGMGTAMLFGLNTQPIIELKEAIEEQSKDIKKEFGKLTKSHEELDGRVIKINDDIKQHGKELSETKDEFQKAVDKVAKVEDTVDQMVEKLATLKGGAAANDGKSLGQIVAGSEVAKNYKGGTAELAIFKGSLYGNQKDITDDAASAGDVTDTVRRPGIQYEPDQPLVVRDLLTVLPIAEAAVEWVRELAKTNNAGAQNGQGTAYGQSDITFEKETSAVETIGHWIPASRQILADARGLQAFIDMRLRTMLKLVEEQQILLGDGLNGNLEGLVPQATAYNTAYTKAGYTNLDQLRKVIMQVALSGYPTTGVMMNPMDWAEIELTKTDDNAYLFANPTQQGEPRVWGKRVVESLSLTASNGVDTGGEFLAGAFGLAATLWDREEISVRVAEQHSDFAIKNMVAMIADERLALTVERPLGLVTGNFANV